MPTAIVKGAGPAGLAAAITLAQSGFFVKVFEKRSKRPMGLGRRNVVAIRPEGLRTLDELGALRYALEFQNSTEFTGCITHMKRGTTVSEFDGLVFPWPLQRYGSAEVEGSPAAREEYKTPDGIQMQVPSCLICLGDLEDCLTRAAHELGVEIVHNATVSLQRHAYTKDFAAISTSATDHSSTSLGVPDLIVCASGKNDFDLQAELDLERHEAILMTADNLPDPAASADPFTLRFNNERDSSIEEQIMSVFGIKDSTSEVGVLDHFTRKYTNPSVDTTHPQPVVEIKMTHSESTALLLQIPRSAPDLHHSPAAYEEYLVSRINALLGASYSSFEQIQQEDLITWGDPSKPISITTTTAPRYVYGNNVILIGDCAMSCSPNSGIGAEIALTVDSASVKALAQILATSPDEVARRQALVEFNMRKAESAVIWSQGSSLFYATKEENERFLRNELVEEPKLVGIQRAIFGPLITAQG